jgi:ubiquinone/menaquinone biosynthesis C-methylase UbiE
LSATAGILRRARWNPFAGLADAVCRRAFSSPEAFLYEVTIARALADIVTPELAKYARGHVLDVGAGGGTVAARLVIDHGLTVVALDPSTAQVRRADRLAARVPGLATCVGSAQDLPFDDASFDSVVSSCAWKHWPDPAIGVRECVRVLRPGGTLAIIEIDGTVTPDAFWRFAKHSRVPWGMKHAYLRFAMRTVVGVAPSPAQLAQSFGDDPVSTSPLLDGPFTIAVATRR